MVEHQQFVPWTAPMDLHVPNDPARVEKVVITHLGLFLVAPFLVALFDGSVRKLKRNITGKAFLRALSPRDAVGLPPG